MFIVDGALSLGNEVAKWRVNSLNTDDTMYNNEEIEKVYPYNYNAL